MSYCLCGKCGKLFRKNTATSLEQTWSEPIGARRFASFEGGYCCLEVPIGGKQPSFLDIHGKAETWGIGLLKGLPADVQPSLNFGELVHPKSLLLGKGLNRSASLSFQHGHRQGRADNFILWRFPPSLPSMRNICL